MARDPQCQRSSCPITCSLDLVGDKWTLVVMRDLLLAGRRHFSDFATAEGISTNILSNRLERLERAGIVERRPDPEDGRRKIYVPTERGVDLLPVVLDLMVWGTDHAGGTSHPELVERARSDRDALIQALRAPLLAG